MTGQLELGAVHSTATLSPCGRYRYDLGRRWGDRDGDLALWIMLNPSTADATVDDHTIRRCIFYSKREGMAGLVVVNLFALRSTIPDALASYADDTEGPDNEHHVRLWLASDDVALVIAAWGAHSTVRLRPEIPAKVLDLAAEAKRRVHCLGRTKAGYPRHPSRLSDAQPLEVLA